MGVLVALVVAIAGVGAAALFSAKDLKAQASEAMQGVSGMSDAVAAQDYASAANAAQEVARIAGEMRDSLSSPLWTVASLVPVYGQDVSSVRAIIGSLDDVASDALVPVTEALAANPPSGLISADKTIDVSAVTQLFATIGDAADAVQTCTDTVSSLPAFHIAKLESTVTPVREKLTEMNDLVQNAADLAPLAGAIFGAEGDRTYLITAQNSAEMRASGGFPGSMGTLRLQGGKIELDEFSKVYDVMAEATSPELGVSEQEISLFGGFMNVARDAGMDPDFTRVADIWATAYEEKTGVHVDGVISVTPAVVQDLLAIAGPITLSDGTVVDGTNATKVLQHDLYWNYLSKETSMSGNGDVADACLPRQRTSPSSSSSRVSIPIRCSSLLSSCARAWRTVPSCFGFPIPMSRRRFPRWVALATFSPTQARLPSARTSRFGSARRWAGTSISRTRSRRPARTPTVRARMA